MRFAVVFDRNPYHESSVGSLYDADVKQIRVIRRKPLNGEIARLSEKKSKLLYPIQQCHHTD